MKFIMEAEDVARIIKRELPRTQATIATLEPGSNVLLHALVLLVGATTSKLTELERDSSCLKRFYMQTMAYF